MGWHAGGGDEAGRQGGAAGGSPAARPGSRPRPRRGQAKAGAAARCSALRLLQPPHGVQARQTSVQMLIISRENIELMLKSFSYDTC